MKIKIRQSGENFKSDMWEFIRNYSNEIGKMLRRDEFINEVFSIEDNDTIDDKFEKIGSIPVLAYGTTYQGLGTRNFTDLGYVSHEIIEVSFEEGVFYGEIKMLNTPIGRPLKNLNVDEVELVPIYNSDGKISFFDLDLNVKYIVGTESYYSVKK
jgi:hypothetical protein